MFQSEFPSGLTPQWGAATQSTPHWKVRPSVLFLDFDRTFCTTKAIGGTAAWMNPSFAFLHAPGAV